MMSPPCISSLEAIGHYWTTEVNNPDDRDCERHVNQRPVRRLLAVPISMVQGFGPHKTSSWPLRHSPAPYSKAGALRLAASLLHFNLDSESRIRGALPE